MLQVKAVVIEKAPVIPHAEHGSQKIKNWHDRMEKNA
jgi:hypothetical protein